PHRVERRWPAEIMKNDSYLPHGKYARLSMERPGRSGSGFGAEDILGPADECRAGIATTMQNLHSTTDERNFRPWKILTPPSPAQSQFVKHVRTGEAGPALTAGENRP